MDGKNIEWDNYFEKGLPWWLSSKESACNVGVSGDTEESNKFYIGELV